MGCKVKNLFVLGRRDLGSYSDGVVASIGNNGSFHQKNDFPVYSLVGFSVFISGGGGAMGYT